MKLHALRDVDVRAISLVKRGANRRRIFLLKSGEERGEELASGRIVKGEGEKWSAFYVVVAEPGATEDPGLYGDQNAEDTWDETEIRKAAHRFMENGALISRMHEDLEPYGNLVENAVALADFSVNGETIKKGSWYIAVKPTDEGRGLIDAGELSGVSIEGYGTRVAKDGDLSYLSDGDLETLAEMDAIAKATDHSSKTHPNLDWSAGENWIDRLPKSMGRAFRRSWIYRAAKHLVYDKGMPRGRAFPVAINAAKRGCATGDLNFKGVQQVNAKSRAEMCAAVALWERMRARAKADN